MIFLVSLFEVFIFLYFCHSSIKKHPGIYYCISIVLAGGYILLSQLGVLRGLPEWSMQFFWGPIGRGGIAIALFTVVMYIGALPKNDVVKQLMQIRGPLSIMACILTLGHNISFGIHYFPELFSSSGELSGARMWATIVTLILMVLMLILMVTSFKFVHKRMSGKLWKKIQRLSYIFYGLIYVHLLLLYVPKVVAKGDEDALVNIIIYSIVFISYYILRAHAAVVRKGRKNEVSLSNRSIIKLS